MSDSMMAKYTEIREAGGEYNVWLVVGVQSFRITSPSYDTIEEAEWMKSMLQKALNNLINEFQIDVMYGGK